MQTKVNTHLETSAKASLEWLEKIDKGHYGESWEAASDLLKMTVTKEDWEQLMTKTRKSLGAVKSRQVLDQRTAKDPKGLPAGDYIVMVYQSSFAKKPVSTELVTLLFQGGQWHVLTYQES